MVDRCRDCGFDLAGGLVEVVPTAHYFMGGVICRADTSTQWPRLFVAGEDASGMHGANRLGGNGVANSTVFGGIAGDVMPPWVAANPGRPEPDEDVLDAEISRALHPFTRSGGNLNALREKLLDTMWDDVGVMRDAAGLDRAGATLELDRDRAARNGHRGERAGVQSQLAGLAQPALPLRDKPGHCAGGQAAREFPRRAFPLRFSRSRRSGRPRTFTVARLVGGNIEIGEQPVEFTHVEARPEPAR